MVVRPCCFPCHPPIRGDLIIRMPSQDDIQYALESTRVLREPDHRIQTFGDTQFEFQMISELMDHAGRVRIRRGKVEAQRPQIIRPEPYREIELDGFDEESRGRLESMIESFRAQGHDLAFLKYGFCFRRGEVSEEIVHDGIDAVRDRVLEDIRRSGNPALAVIEGVDDTWEISLLKFSFEMILHSHRINAFDFKRRGLI